MREPPLEIKETQRRLYIYALDIHHHKDPPQVSMGSICHPAWPLNLLLALRIRIPFLARSHCAWCSYCPFVCSSSNGLGDDGGTAVAGALGRLTALQSLDLR